MARATTQTGALAILQNCYIQTPQGIIQLRSLPDITDSKASNYSNETIMGRSNPIVNYSHSEPRTISMELTFMVTELADIQRNLQYLRLIESLVYPGEPTNAPYAPPQIVNIVCGQLFGQLDDGSPAGICCILKNYSVKCPPDVAWDEVTYLPYRFSVSTSWEAVYACKDLPCNTRIIALGR
jgi:hypothetical protein